MQRCRTCPNCGHYAYARVARSFRFGTWKRCKSCGTEYKPPTSLLVAVVAILAAAPPSMLAIAFGPRWMDIFLPSAIVAAGLIGYGVLTIVRYARTPTGPLDKGGPAGFAVLPPTNQTPE